MGRRRRRVMVALVAAVVSVTAVPASAKGGIQITQITYDPSGPDTGTNRHLNREVLVIRNNGSKVKSLSGWTLRDAGSQHVYRIPSGFRLRPGKVVRIHSGRGSNDSNDLYWRRSWYVWNNTGDRAVLKNAQGSAVDTCKYPGGGATARC
jgi:hypothetical protein